MTSSIEQQTPDAAPILVSELARRWRVCPATIYKEIRAGHLKAVRFGNTYRIEQADADDFIASCRTGGKEVDSGQGTVDSEEGTEERPMHGAPTNAAIPTASQEPAGVPPAPAGRDADSEVAA
jgi:excisionase family DNA binding protein